MDTKIYGDTMTDVWIKSPTCECEYLGPPGKNKLVLVEGNTAIWACPHVDPYIQERKKEWVLQT